MNDIKKIAISCGWLCVSLVVGATFPGLRSIGMTWVNIAGFFRLIGLSFFLIIGLVLPAIFAVLTWYGRPRQFYNKI